MIRYDWLWLSISVAHLAKVPGNRALIARGHLRWGSSHISAGKNGSRGHIGASQSTGQGAYLEPLEHRGAVAPVHIDLVHQNTGEALVTRKGLDLLVGARLLPPELVAVQAWQRGGWDQCRTPLWL